MKYAGIGSRKAPSAVLGYMTQVARQLRERGWHSSPKDSHGSTRGV
jgi:hypothetical protein